MRTTIDLPDELFRTLKREAATRGTSLKELITEAVTHQVGLGSDQRQRVDFPLVASEQPSRVAPDPDSIATLLDGGDLPGGPGTNVYGQNINL